jgi:RHS repeat-associated protein
LGITDAERQKLATLYTAGQSLWRVPVAHFSSWDFNWPFGPPDDAETPPGEEPESDDPTNSSCELPGSTIYCQDQVLGESIAVGGTPFTLHYASDRAPGRKAAFNLDIRLSGAQLPQSLKRIELEVLTAGQRFTQSFAPQPNLRTGYTWDGKDGYGRTLQGQTLATVRVGYTYDGVYQKTTRFGSNGNGTVITGSKTRQEITLWQVYSVPLGLFDARALGLGGWSLNIHHLYDAARGRLFLGNGERRDLSALPATLSTVSGNGMASHCGDGGPAVDACLFGVNDVAVAPDGSLYLADTFNERVRRIGPDGIITTVAGTGTEGYNGDTIPATSAQLRGPTAVAVGPDGSLYIADNFNQRVRRVDTAGLITTIAGTGAVGNDGDGGRATAATLIHLNDLAVAPDGALYLATGSRVRRIGPDGIITTVAGGGELEPAEADGGPAVDAKLFDVSDVALGPDGSLYLADSGHHRIRRVDTSGIISTVAGNGVAGFSGDGGPATSAQLKDPGGVAVSLTGNLYIADRYRVRLVSPEGTIRTVAGTGQCCSTVDRGPATALTTGARGLALGPEGHLYLADSAFYVRKLAATLPGQTVGETAVPAEDGSELYLFDSRGRHLRTLDPLTGAVRYQFGYTNSGYLATVTDGDGTVTTVERDGSGNPTALVGPDGQRTGLALGADGYLARVADALGNTTAFSYTSGGLLAAMTDARGGAYAFAYDGLGRLTKDTDPAGGFTALTIHTTPRGRRVDAVSSLGRTRSYALERLPTGETGVTNIGADGLATTVTISTSGVTRVNSPDGTQITLVEDANPRWGMIAPLPAALTVRLPSGLTYATTHQETVTLAAPDNPLSVTGASWTWGVNGRTYKNDYDGATRTYTFQSPAGRQSTATVDALGRVTGEQMLGLLPVSYGYDDRGRLTTISQGGRSFTLGYNDAGYPEQLTDPVGRTVTLSYDAAGRLTNQTLTGNRPLGVAYDAAGNLAALTPPDRSAHGFDYSPVGLVARYRPPAVNPNAGEVQYSYNADGELTRLTHADGQAVDFSYDNAGRLSSQSEPQGATTLAYDPTTGNLATISTPGGVNLAFAYDGFLLTSETLAGPVVGNVTWGYDNDLRVATTSVNGSNGVENQYDADGLLVSAGDLTVKRSPQTGFITGSTLASVETTQSFNGFGELSSYATTYNGAERYAVTYAHDSVGRITTLTETVESETHVYAYSYDAAGRLATVVKDGATVAGYTYDANGNRLSATLNGNTVGGTYDAQDRLLSYGGATYTYTANGELKTKSQNGATTGYSHDLFGNLLGVNLSSGTQIEYILDGRDRRVGKRVNGSLVQGFLYDGQLQIIAELDGNNSVVSRFVYGSRSTIPEYMIKGGVRYRIIADHLGSPRLVINTATGQVAQQLAYDAFGNVLLDTNPGFQPFGFAGGLYDRDTGLTHFGARDYDAATGRWTAKDPVGFQGGDANLYGYVLNDPVNAIDPTGQWAHVVAGALIGGGVDLLGQYLLNGGNFDCIDWGNVLFAAGLGALGGVVPRPFNSANQVISHWGGPLKPGAWVMTGKPGLRNWLLAGGPELVKKGPAYRLGQGLEYTVPKGTLKYPPGLEWFKGLFGQRIYLP